MPTANPSSCLTDHRRCQLLLKLSNSSSKKINLLKNIIERKRIDQTTGCCIWPKLVTDVNFDWLSWSGFHAHRRIWLVLVEQNSNNKDDSLGDVITAELPADWTKDCLDNILNDLIAKLAAQLATEMVTETYPSAASPAASNASTPSTPSTELSSNSSLLSLNSSSNAGQSALPFTPIEASEIVGWSDSKRTKRASARREKQRADLKLLLGDFRAARSSYKASAETLRSLNDWLWYAAALEGLSAVADAEAEADYDDASTSSPTTSTSDDLEAPEATSTRCREALSEYQKFSAASWLAIEAALKSVRALRGFERHCRTRRWPAVEAVQFLELPSTERLLAGIVDNAWCVGDLLEELGFKRRAVLHRWLAANRLIGLDAGKGCDDDDNGGFGDLDSAIELLTRCLNDANDADADADDAERLTAPKLRVTLACRLVSLLRRQRVKSCQAWRRALKTLGNLGRWLTAVECDQLFDCLAEAVNCALVTNPPVEAPLELPEWLSVDPEPMPDSPILIPCSAKNPASISSPSALVANNNKPLFIYTPLSLDGANSNKQQSNLSVYWSIEELSNQLNLSVRHSLPIVLQLGQPRVLVRQIGVDNDNNEDKEEEVSNWLATVATADSDSNCDVIELAPTTTTCNLKLSVKPNKIGQFNLLGLDCYLMPSRLPLRCRFPASSSFSVASVRVAPSLPKLRLDWLGAGDTVLLSIDPLILSGQSVATDVKGLSASLQLRLANIGSLPISQVSLDLVPLGLASWSESNLARQLPINPGESAALTLYVGHGPGRHIPDFGRHRLKTRVRYSDSTVGDCSNGDVTLGREAVLYGHVIVERNTPTRLDDAQLDNEEFVDDGWCEDSAAMAEWLAGQLVWKCNCDGGCTDAPGLRLTAGQIRAVSVEVRYRGSRTLPGPVRLVWPQQAGLLVAGQTDTQLPELSSKHRLARLSSSVLLLGNDKEDGVAARQLMATLFFPSTNVKVTKAWSIVAV